MTETTRAFSPKLRWLVPAATAVVVGLAFTIPAAMAEAAPPDLPARSASEILTSVLERTPEPLSGTVVHTSRLGLPELPATQKGIAPVDLLTGSTTVRVWTDAETSSRMNLVGQASEYAMVAQIKPGESAQAWTYSSSDNEVTHFTYTGELPQEPAHPAGVEELTPDALADKLLVSLDDSTEVTVDRATSVAGRDSYQLVFTPKSRDTLIGSVRVAIDAENNTPLRVQVWSAQDPETASLETAFSEISFAKPDASVFNFVPPAGATVNEIAVPMDEATAPADGAEHKKLASEGAPTKDDVSVVGTGWASIVVLNTDGLTKLDPQAPDSEGFDANAFETMLTPAAGGKALSSNLISVLITDDGRVLAGAVPVSALEAAAR